eukprot:2613985-Amphidinium_carterae.1
MDICVLEFVCNPFQFLMSHPDLCCSCLFPQESTSLGPVGVACVSARAGTVACLCSEAGKLIAH